MLDAIEETLRQLRIAMESHRRSLANEEPLPVVPDLSRPVAAPNLRGPLA